MDTTQLTENWLNATMKSQRLEKERDALRRALANARQQVYDRNVTLRVRDKKIEFVLRQGVELEAERDALQARLKLADGLAEALEAVKKLADDICWGTGGGDCLPVVNQALAAWRTES